MAFNLIPLSRPQQAEQAQKELEIQRAHVIADEQRRTLEEETRQHQAVWEWSCAVNTFNSTLL